MKEIPNLLSRVAQECLETMSRRLLGSSVAAAAAAAIVQHFLSLSSQRFGMLQRKQSFSCFQALFQFLNGLFEDLDFVLVMNVVFVDRFS